MRARPREVAILARTPVPGAGKSRLAVDIGAEAAAALAAAMLHDVVSVAAEAGLSARLCLDGPLDHPTLDGLDLPREPQAPGDLGARITRALRAGGVAIGGDSPTLPAGLLAAAARSPADVVCAPAFDGGYVLVGCDDPTGLFEGVPWSSPLTFSAQIARARALGRGVEILPFWYDVDTTSDLTFLRSHLAVLPPAAAPRTRAFLELHAPPPR